MVVTDVENIGEDAFQASITVTAPSNLVEISRLIGSDVDNVIDYGVLVAYHTNH